MNKCQKRLITGAMILGTASATVPMAGCEPVTTAVVVVTAITLEQFVVWIAEAAVGWAVIEIGEAIYFEIENALTGDKTQYQVKLQPGDILEVNEDGTITVR